MIPNHIEIKPKNIPWKGDSISKNLSPKNKKVYTITQRKCPVCGNLLLIPAGSCHVCQICGTSNGCS